MAKSESLATIIKVTFIVITKVSDFAIQLHLIGNWHTKSQGPKKKLAHFTRGRIHPYPAHTACIYQGGFASKKSQRTMTYVQVLQCQGIYDIRPQHRSRYVTCSVQIPELRLSSKLFLCFTNRVVKLMQPCVERTIFTFSTKWGGVKNCQDPAYLVYVLPLVVYRALVQQTSKSTFIV